MSTTRTMQSLITYQSSIEGNPLYREVVTNYDVTLGSKKFIVNVDLLGYSTISFQVEWTGLTGTLNGTVALQQSHRGVFYDIINDQTITLNSASGSTTLAEYDFSGRYAAVDFVKSGITGGIMTITFIAKRT